MRTCSEATKTAIEPVDNNPPGDIPGWLHAAIWDALHDKPMSLRRELRMCEALGIEPPLQPVEVLPCPIHGIPHVAGPCSHDGPIAAVVVLHEGEAVRQTKRQRQPSPELARIMRAFSKLTPQEVSGGCYTRKGERR